MISSAQQCSRVDWFLDGEPKVTIVTDGAEMEEWLGQANAPKLTVQSCKVCRDTQHAGSENGDAGQCSYRFADVGQAPDGIYSGQCFGGKAQGRGEVRYDAGDRYEGEFLNGIKSGFGKYAWSNGNRYEGQFLNGDRTGRGTFTWRNGDRYEGQFLNGDQTGRGTLTWRNGARHEGEFLNGRQHGQGTFTERGGERQVGYFRDGKFWDGVRYPDNPSRSVCEVRNHQPVVPGCFSWD